MFRNTTFRTVWLPIGLTLLALVFLNWGLYKRVGPQARPAPATLPFTATFNSGDLSGYEILGGDWQIRDKALVQINTNGYDLSILSPLKVPVDQTFAVETKMRLLGGKMGGGLMFNAQQPISRQLSHMVRFNIDQNRLWLIYGYFGDDSNFTGQGSTAVSIAPDNKDTHTLRVLVGKEQYALQLDGRTIVANIPLKYHGGTVGVIASTSQVAFDDLHVEAVDNPPVTSLGAGQSSSGTSQAVQPGQVVLNEQFKEPKASQENWIPFSGNWQFQQDMLVQAQGEGYDRNIGYRQSFKPPYTLRVNFQHRTGIGGGVLVQMTQPDSKNGAIMVRYVEDGNNLMWGSFDANGVFQGIGSAPVPQPGTSAHTLEVMVDAQSFTLHLDGQPVGGSIALPQPGVDGYIGLSTAQSTVAYSSVQVLGVTTPASPVLTPTLNLTTTAGQSANSTAMQLAITNGTWISDENSITQTNTSGVDFVAGTGLAAETFEISVDVKMITATEQLGDTAAVTKTETQDLGGGLLFHMSGRDDPRLAMMVRFNKGGREIMWGSYNADGKFQGQGSAPINLPLSTTRTLSLIVHRGSYDIRVNGTSIIKSVPTQRQSGWIGLVSFRGPVEFSNLRVTLGGK